jgi:hypothetical protein
MGDASLLPPLWAFVLLTACAQPPPAAEPDPVPTLASSIESVAASDTSVEPQQLIRRAESGVRRQMPGLANAALRVVLLRLDDTHTWRVRFAVNGWRSAGDHVDVIVDSQAMTFQVWAGS